MCVCACELAYVRVQAVVFQRPTWLSYLSPVQSTTWHKPSRYDYAYSHSLAQYLPLSVVREFRNTKYEILPNHHRSTMYGDDVDHRFLERCTAHTWAGILQFTIDREIKAVIEKR